MIALCLTFWETDRGFLKWLYHFRFPPANIWGFKYLHILTNSYYVFFILAVPVGMKWLLVMLLICIFLKTNDTEIFILDICRSSLNKSLFKSFAPFLIKWCFYCWAFYIFLILGPYQIYDVQVFSPIFWIVFHFFC